MMGLLDNLFSEDPKKQALLALASGLLSGSGRTNKNFMADVGSAIPQGLLAYQQSRSQQMKSAEEEQQKQLRQMQMEQMRQGMQEQQAVRGLAERAFAPGVAPPVRNDDMGNQMPMVGAGGGMPEYARGMQAINPERALGLQAQLAQMRQKNLQKLGEGDRLIDADSGREVAHNPKPEGPRFGKINPSEYTADSFRKFAASGKYEDLMPYRKPDNEKPPAAHFYEGAQGPMWATPPTASNPTGASMPVVGPDGKPMPGKKRDQPLTEAQSRGTLFLGQMREAEKAIEGLKFKPETTTAQAQLASALKAKESGTVSGAVMNFAAGKEAQQYAQAAEQWSESFLRIKTGAASTRDEVLRNIRTFFPQPGDSPQVIKQKNAARVTATKQMEIIAGHGTQQLEAQGGASGGWSIKPIP